MPLCAPTCPACMCTMGVTQAVIRAHENYLLRQRVYAWLTRVQAVSR